MIETTSYDCNVGAWRSPVAHLLWEQGVGGSNPLAPTILINNLQPHCMAAQIDVRNDVRKDSVSRVHFVPIPMI